nr:GNAT family N-acetyltransferase [Frankia sp. Cppng1_Ct_nod]
MSAALDNSFRVLKRERVISIIHPENAASIRVAEKLGLRLAETAERGGQPRSIYATTHDDWAGRTGDL